jgi:hypothetical protein
VIKSAFKQGGIRSLTMTLGVLRTYSGHLLMRRALELAGVEFFDENGGGPGARLRKGPQKKRLRRRVGFTFTARC